MHPNRQPVVAVTLLLLAGFQTEQPGADARAELRKLQGAWTLVSEVHEGKETPADAAKKTRLLVDAERNWKIEVNGKVVGGGMFTLDPSKRPKWINYAITLGEDKGKDFTAIYELDADSFKHCGVLKGARPTEFTAKAGSERFLTVFKREKP